MIAAPYLELMHGALIFMQNDLRGWAMCQSTKTNFEQYMRCIDRTQKEMEAEDSCKDEIEGLSQKLNHLQVSQKHMIGEDLLSFTLKDLHELDQKLEMGLKRIRLEKCQLLLKEIDDVDKKGQHVQEESERLQKEICKLQEVAEAMVVEGMWNIQLTNNQDPQFYQAMYDPLLLQPSQLRPQDSANLQLMNNQDPQFYQAMYNPLLLQPSQPRQQDSANTQLINNQDPQFHQAMYNPFLLQPSQPSLQDSAYFQLMSNQDPQLYQAMYDPFLPQPSQPSLQDSEILRTYLQSCESLPGNDILQSPDARDNLTLD